MRLAREPRGPPASPSTFLLLGVPSYPDRTRVLIFANNLLTQNPTWVAESVCPLDTACPRHPPWWSQTQSSPHFSNSKWIRKKNQQQFGAGKVSTRVIVHFLLFWVSHSGYLMPSLCALNTPHTMISHYPYIHALGFALFCFLVKKISNLRSYSCYPISDPSPLEKYIFETTPSKKLFLTEDFNGFIFLLHIHCQFSLLRIFIEF